MTLFIQILILNINIYVNSKYKKCGYTSSLCACVSTSNNNNSNINNNSINNNIIIIIIKNNNSNNNCWTYQVSNLSVWRSLDEDVMLPYVHR